MARAHAARDIDDTLHLVRDRTELEIARYRIWVFATVTPMSLVVAATIGGGSYRVGLYFAVCLGLAVGLRLLVRRLGSPRWISVGCVLVDVATMSLVFPLAATNAPDPSIPESFSTYVFGASLVGILAINFLRDSPLTAWVGATAAVVAFFAILVPLHGFAPGQVPVALIILMMGAVGAAMARRTRATLENFARMRLLRRFVPEHLMSRVLDSSVDTLLDPGGEERMVTMLASDLRGFTMMSERLAPAEVVRQLNALHKVMLDVVHRHGGMLDKFMGDGMLVVFGLREEVADHGAGAAVACARDMLTALCELNRQREGEGLEALRMGIGVHSGPVIAGSIGAADRLEFTVIGDTVNTAARVESLTKEARVDVLVTAATAALLGEPAHLRELAAMSARGKRDVLQVFGLVDA